MLWLSTKDLDTPTISNDSSPGKPEICSRCPHSAVLSDYLPQPSLVTPTRVSNPPCLIHSTESYGNSKYHEMTYLRRRSLGSQTTTPFEDKIHSKCLGSFDEKTLQYSEIHVQDSILVEKIERSSAPASPQRTRNISKSTHPTLFPDTLVSLPIQNAQDQSPFPLSLPLSPSKQPVSLKQDSQPHGSHKIRDGFHHQQLFSRDPKQQHDCLKLIQLQKTEQSSQPLSLTQIQLTPPWANALAALGRIRQRKSPTKEQENVQVDSYEGNKLGHFISSGPGPKLNKSHTSISYAPLTLNRRQFGAQFGLYKGPNEIEDRQGSSPLPCARLRYSLNDRVREIHRVRQSKLNESRNN
ncbi:unnamed protein product [Protopolystoma xenopodis]|uniref:Uncharacterized protein n=1 Tax=Protopolystoma xenopodis TaxID=117903 RepID=A0A448XB85_9PLAT|nr:unnamed protein product [Protopolystoma xenopodis]